MAARFQGTRDWIYEAVEAEDIPAIRVGPTGITHLTYCVTDEVFDAALAEEAKVEGDLSRVKLVRKVRALTCASVIDLSCHPVGGG